MFEKYNVCLVKEIFASILLLLVMNIVVREQVSELGSDECGC